MRRAFVIVSAVLLAAFALQFVFAAVGAFTKPAGDGAYALHSITGMVVIPLLSLLTMVCAALARAPGRVVAQSVLPLGLVLLQALIAVLANAFTDASGASTALSLTIGALHAVNGIIAVHVVVGVLQAAEKLAAGRPAENPAVEKSPA
ncbi:DUF6220 domain-containing protein [Actinoplanes sp. NEAU-A12]|uniref:DUF6220 domain-containing protein n=1 Tax=Actinoplanes sandaracinus TaxID=3045177 RepID=A0ABT6WXV3_9ACTN|nr:DUF6220 domain-containing protein [Actinoplanes sandaracinus]MDI6104575.1 DUF6220 domain-containing protein [Actinoplanes sandaracinus]